VSLSPTMAAMLSSALGMPVSLQTGLDVVHAIRDGLPAGAVDRLVKEGELTPAEVDRVVLPRKTLAHRKTIGTLAADQGDRLVRVIRIIAQTYDTFGDRAKAQLWLRRKTSALNGEQPLDLLDTEEGAREVEALLTRIAHGIAA
jgi:putative toxin-antitoxin system antitoxin component (TIGR02293 family)